MKFQPPSWPHHFPLAHKKGASSVSWNNCESLKIAKEEKISPTWKHPKRIILRWASPRFTQTELQWVASKSSIWCQSVILQQDSKSSELQRHLHFGFQVWNTILWGSPEVQRSKWSKTHLPSLECHAIFVLNPKARFERFIFLPLPKAFVTSWTTTNPNILVHLFQDCHLFPASCQNLQLFLLATFTGQLLVVKSCSTSEA